MQGDHDTLVQGQSARSITTANVSKAEVAWVVDRVNQSIAESVDDARAQKRTLREPLCQWVDTHVPTASCFLWLRSRL